MDGHHTAHLLLIEHCQHGFGNRATKQRVLAGTEFVDEHQRFGIGVFRAILHFSEVCTVGTEITFDGLVIANIGEYMPESAASRGGVRRDNQTRLNHQLKQSDCFHADRSEEHTSELQSLMRISSALFCLNQNPLTSNPIPTPTN